MRCGTAHREWWRRSVAIVVDCRTVMIYCSFGFSSNFGKVSFPVLVPFLVPVPALALAPVPDPDNSLSPNQKFVQCLAFPMFEAVLLAAHFDSLTFGFLPMLDPVLVPLRPLSVA